MIRKLKGIFFWQLIKYKLYVFKKFIIYNLLTNNTHYTCKIHRAITEFYFIYVIVRADSLTPFFDILKEYF